jgi:4-amino-4-deoxy-L-arabinose transferase-like glycosyltransferase
VAAVAAALASLPLHSPNDALFNTLIVLIGALFVGTAAGAVWEFLSRRPNPGPRFAVIWMAGLALWVLLFAAGNTQLDRMFSFGATLAAIVFSLTWVLTMAGARIRPLRSWWTASIGMVAALAVGLALASEGDQKSGRLELPPRAGSLVMPALFDSNEIGQDPRPLRSSAVDLKTRSFAGLRL